MTGVWQGWTQWVAAMDGLGKVWQGPWHKEDLLDVLNGSGTSAVSGETGPAMSGLPDQDIPEEAKKSPMDGLCAIDGKSPVASGGRVCRFHGGGVERLTTRYRGGGVERLTTRYRGGSGTGAGLPDGVACSHPGCLSHVTHPCEGCGRIAGHSHSLEDTMMQFGFRWVSLGAVTEVQSLFPVEQAQDGTRSAPFLAGIARMRVGDTWDQNMGIAVAMVRFRDNGRYNRQELRLADALRKQSSEKLPSNCWGDFYLTLGAFLEVLRIRTEFRIALAVDAGREAEALRWFVSTMDQPGGLLSGLDDDDQPLERALAAVRRVAGIPVVIRNLPCHSSITESGMAESCAQRILKETGPFVHIKVTS